MCPFRRRRRLGNIASTCKQPTPPPASRAFGSMPIQIYNCNPLTAYPPGACGTFPTGCGGNLQCGVCQAAEVCVGGGCCDPFVQVCGKRCPAPEVYCPKTGHMPSLTPLPEHEVAGSSMGLPNANDGSAVLSVRAVVARRNFAIAGPSPGAIAQTLADPGVRGRHDHSSDERRDRSRPYQRRGLGNCWSRARNSAARVLRGASPQWANSGDYRRTDSPASARRLLDR